MSYSYSQLAASVFYTVTNTAKLHIIVSQTKWTTGEEARRVWGCAEGWAREVTNVMMSERSQVPARAERDREKAKVMQSNTQRHETVEVLCKRRDSVSSRVPEVQQSLSFPLVTSAEKFLWKALTHFGELAELAQSPHLLHFQPGFTVSAFSFTHTP